MIFISSIDRGQ